VHLGLAGARPTVSKETAITNVIILPNDFRNKGDLSPLFLLSTILIGNKGKGNI
jgi:hypothetical protein